MTFDDDDGLFSSAELLALCDEAERRQLHHQPVGEEVAVRENKGHPGQQEQVAPAPADHEPWATTTEGGQRQDSRDSTFFESEEVLAMCEQLEQQAGCAAAPVSAAPARVESADGGGMVDIEPSLPSLDELLSTQLELPPEIAEAYKRRGLKEPYRWQVECLREAGVLEGRNLLYCAPTSGGKSFVAEVLLLRRIFKTQRKALFVLPFVAVVREKVAHLRGLLTMYNMRRPKGQRIKIMAFHGKKGGRGLGRSHIGVCTIEKANSLVNKLIQEGKIGMLSCIVVDELHMLADSHRGYLLELLLSKVSFLRKSSEEEERAAAVPPAATEVRDPTDCKEQQSRSAPTEAARIDMQVTGLSATLPNLDEIAAWSGAVLHSTNFRPMPLVEAYKLGNALYDSSGNLIRELGKPKAPQDQDSVALLVKETVLKKHQVLVFCFSRRHCESCAMLVASEHTGLAAPEGAEEGRKALIKQLTDRPTSLHPTLAKTLPAGVAFHHAGLTDVEKDGVEDAFRKGHVSVIVATSTLGAGINLPAARVIFRSVRPPGRGQLDLASYRQMAGRAGRAGHAEYGEVILIARTTADAQEAQRLMTAPLPRLTSCLDPEADGGRALVRAILEAVASNALASPDKLEYFLLCTLMATQASQEKRVTFLKYGRRALHYLVSTQILELQDDGKALAATKLGRAIFQSSFSPDEGLLVTQDLQQARQRLVLEGDLHLLYLVTPVSHGIVPDFGKLNSIYQRALKSEPAKALIFELVGLDEIRLDRWSRQPPAYARGLALEPLLLSSPSATSRGDQQMPTTIVLEGDKLAVMRARRLWAALALQELVNDRPLDHVAMAFQVDKGELQALQAGAETMSGMVQVLLTQLDWTLLAKALENVVVTAEAKSSKKLQPLLQIPRLELTVARALYDADIRSPAALASESLRRLAEVLRKVRPFAQEKVVTRINVDQTQWFHHAACRLQQAAKDVLVREDKHRRARVKMLKAHWSGGARDHDSINKDDAEPSSSDESRAEGDDDDHDESSVDGEGGGDDGDRAHAAAAGGIEDTTGMDVELHDWVSGSGAGRGRARIWETPAALGKPVLRAEDYPLKMVVRTPSPAPSAPDQYLYQPELPPQHSTSYNQGAVGPAHEVCLAASAIHLPPPLRLAFAPEGLQTLPRSYAPQSSASSLSHFVSPTCPRALHALRQRWSDATCTAFTLHFRPVPLLLARNDPSNTFRFVCTDTVTTFPLRKAEPPLDGPVVLTGMSLCFDARRTYYLSLPPPFRNRPFTSPCLGDDPDEDTGNTRAAGMATRTAPSGKQPRAEASDISDVASVARTPSPCLAQRLPEQAISRIFSYCGYTHGAHMAGSAEYAKSSSTRNAVFLLCRRWNRVGCERYFNLRCSLKAWHMVRTLFGRERPKVTWDAPTALAALRERGVVVAAPVDDPKVGLAVLGEKYLKVKGSGKFHIVMPPAANEIDALAAPAAAIMQLAAAVEVAMDTQKLLEPYRRIECPLLRVVSEMSFYGLRVDRGWFAGPLIALQDRLLLLQELANAYGGGFINLNREADVHHMLYGALQLRPPVGWTKRSRVFGAKEDGSKTVLGPTDNAGLQAMVDQSPAVKVVLEWRRLSVALRSLQKLRGHARLHHLLGSHRVRYRVNPYGTSTGRMRITDPPMQQVAHAVLVNRTPRVTIHNEIASGEDALPAELFVSDTSAINMAPSQAEDGDECISVSVVRADSHLWTRANTGDFTYCQQGILRAILPVNLDSPFARLGPRGMTQEDPPVLEESPQSEHGSAEGVGDAGDGTTKDAPQSLADYWRDRGFNYTEEEAKSISQVVVEFPARNTLLTFPADKVFRRCEHIQDPDAAAAKAFPRGDTGDGGEEGQTVEECAYHPRAAFPAARGFVLISADYSQIELRMLAHFSEDPLLCQAFDRDEDVFAHLAATWRKLPVDQVTKQIRDEAKQMAYAILYGQSVVSTAEQMGITRAEADNLQRSFLATYPGVRRFINECTSFCRKAGYVETLLGRRRYLPNIHSTNASERGHAERASVNSVCQGSAADLIKLAMVNIHHHQESGRAKAAAAAASKSDNRASSAGDGKGSAGVGWLDGAGAAAEIRPWRLLLQIHDELVYEVREDLVPAVIRVVKRCMEKAVTLKVPLRVNIKQGANWAQLSDDGPKPDAHSGPDQHQA